LWVLLEPMPDGTPRLLSCAQQIEGPVGTLILLSSDLRSIRLID
jgi:hypothetical protein